MFDMIYTVIGYFAAMLMIVAGVSIIITNIITNGNDSNNPIRDICFSVIICLFGLYIVFYIALTR